MKSVAHFKDEALVLRKTTVNESHQRVTFLTHHHGRIVLTSFGSKKLTSKRLSHLETGNVVKLVWRVDGDFATVTETELLFAHSKVKEDESKMHAMYAVLFIVMRLLPEDVPEEVVYARVLSFLKHCYSNPVNRDDVQSCVGEILLVLGYIDDDTQIQAHFDPLEHVEGLIGRKLQF